MIKNIIFDLGNVLLNLAESDNYKAMTPLLDQSKCADINEMVFFPFEKGQISEESFFNRMQRRSKKLYSFEIYVRTWNAMLLDFPKDRMELLKNLSNRYRLFLLSNTNITHIRVVHRHLESEYGITHLNQLPFEKVYFSFEIGMRKPDVEIYEYVMNDSSLNAAETLFIDDNIENLNGAKKAGLNTHHHNPQQDITAVIEKLLTQ